MKTDKEYPATHSMSTAWYLVDDDDNVAIMQFEESLEPPIGNAISSVLPETTFVNILSDNRVSTHGVHLTEEQMNKLLGMLHSPAEENDWREIVVQIDNSREKEFWDCISVGTIEHLGVVSRELGLHVIDTFDDIWEYADSASLVEGSPLDTLVKSGIIQKVVRLRNWCEEEGVKNHIFGGLRHIDLGMIPYYIYWQSEVDDDVFQRVHSPKNPVNLSQVDIRKRSNLIRVSGRLDEIEYIPICNIMNYEDR